jgi:hypothetical protein
MSKGRIIVIDNEIEFGFIVNRRYVMAHTNNVILCKPFSNPNSTNFEMFQGLGFGAINDPLLNNNNPLPQNNNLYHNPHGNQMTLTMLELGMHDF